MPAECMSYFTSGRQQSICISKTRSADKHVRPKIDTSKNIDVKNIDNYRKQTPNIKTWILQTIGFTW
jgi:hypothetical protein